MSINWVMVPDGKRPFVPLPRERIVATSPARTSFSLKTPKPPAGWVPSAADPPPSATSVDISSPAGIAYITTQRLVYIPELATPTFTSFSVSLLSLLDTRVTAPFFGPNVLVGAVAPRLDGGIPPVLHPPYSVELRLTFKDGGAYDLHQKFCELRERAIQAREIVHEIGGNAALQEVHGEQLPAYEEAFGSGASGSRYNTSASVTSQSQTRPTATQQQADDLPPPFTSAPSGSRSNGAPASGPPDEPPPSYDTL